MKLGSVLLLALIFIFQNLELSEAKGLRMRVLGTAGRGSFGRGSKPWNQNSRNREMPGYNDRDNWWEKDDDQDRSGEGPRPCVGLCYFMKLQRLAKKKEESENSTPLPMGATTKPTIPTTTISYYKLLYSTEKPCIGLCYYYKKLGIKNPYEEEYYYEDGEEVVDGEHLEGLEGEDLVEYIEEEDLDTHGEEKQKRRRRK